jgi:allantoicase
MLALDLCYGSKHVGRHLSLPAVGSFTCTAPTEQSEEHTPQARWLFLVREQETGTEVCVVCESVSSVSHSNPITHVRLEKNSQRGPTRIMVAAGRGIFIPLSQHIDSHG